MLNNLKKKSEGFTIIEVLIVLAIAGLIILIVFLAVPALQRNSRNTSRKNDVGRVGASVSEFVSNNNGKLPTAADLTTVRNSIGNLSQYEPTEVVLASGSQAAVNTLTQVRIVTGAKCGAAGATTGGTSRQAAIQWAHETTAAPQGLCQDV